MDNTESNATEMAWLYKGVVDYVDNWFLMGTPWPVLATWVLYLAFVLKLGPAYMAKRSAFQLKNTLVIYNMFQIALSCYVFYYGLNILYNWGLVSQDCAIERRDSQYYIMRGVYTYLLAKISELLDTVFFVLRKKMNQVTFLHVYHHSLMMLSTWFALKFNPTDAVVFLGTINSLVHVVMYGYYGLSAFPSLTKYLWWKKYITSFQLDLSGFDWDEETQGIILSASYYGYIVTHMLAERFGGKYSLGFGVLSTVVFTLLTPWAVTIDGATGLIVLRVLEGLGEGTTFPALNAMLARWAPITERGRMGSLVFGAAQIGNIVGTYFSGLIMTETGDRHSKFYLFGAVSILWFILWIGHDYGYFTMVTDLPKYMTGVLKFDIHRTGTLAVLPYAVMWMCYIMFGWMCDKIVKRNWMMVTNAMKTFTTITSLGPRICMILASYSGCDTTAVVNLLTASMALMGAFYPGMKVNALDLSSNYAGTIMAIVNGIGAITSIIAPYLVGLLTPDNTLVQWCLVFWITIAVFIVKNLVFVGWASGDEQWWNITGQHPRKQQEAEVTRFVNAEVKL